MIGDDMMRRQLWRCYSENVIKGHIGCRDRPYLSISEPTIPKDLKKSKNSQHSEPTTKGIESSEGFHKKKKRKSHDESPDMDKNLATRVATASLGLMYFSWVFVVENEKQAISSMEIQVIPFMEIQVENEE
ncbi:hypothetical protein ACFE04_011921 [Oxalis oulophora]